MAVSWVSRRAEARSAVPDEAVQRGRRTVVRLVFVVYFLFLLEGMLRKWVVPQLSDVLYFPIRSTSFRRSNTTSTRGR